MEQVFNPNMENGGTERYQWEKLFPLGCANRLVGDAGHFNVSPITEPDFTKFSTTSELWNKQHKMFWALGRHSNVCDAVNALPHPDGHNINCNAESSSDSKSPRKDVCCRTWQHYDKNDKAHGFNPCDWSMPKKKAGQGNARQGNLYHPEDHPNPRLKQLTRVGVGQTAAAKARKDAWTCKRTAKVKESEKFLLSPLDVVAKLLNQELYAYILSVDEQQLRQAKRKTQQWTTGQKNTVIISDDDSDSDSDSDDDDNDVDSMNTELLKQALTTCRSELSKLNRAKKRKRKRPKKKWKKKR